ncbi:D-3-phosphoglycerate dehydrogenase 3 [Cucumis melo var. makuwa]|uniref:D-3-phosphoglycerate dehydrogenase 3 n=1 Tax=Cucumis melo var. makuwa TaxID=1194695 RepID=A0A5A7TE49_CUCMM|nr:D-3-phosphoglycerate dehydrogenase 3 [Cucumis melo var. makuwa]TYK16031.1 D-3-phosphoglycerate dehydrogenase 3 [Cucumis melo var. makuwa]
MGSGKMGLKVARRVKGLGMQVIAHDAYKAAGQSKSHLSLIGVVESSNIHHKLYFASYDARSHNLKDRCYPSPSGDVSVHPAMDSSLDEEEFPL